MLSHAHSLQVVPPPLRLGCGFLCAPRCGARGGWALGIVTDVSFGQSRGWAAAPVLPFPNSRPETGLRGLRAQLHGRLHVTSDSREFDSQTCWLCCNTDMRGGHCSVNRSQ